MEQETCSYQSKTILRGPKPFHHHTKTITEKIRTNVTITVVIQLSGEMGNHLSKLANGYAKAWDLEEQYGIQTDIWFRHQEHPKWVRVRDSMKTCFLMAAKIDFERGNSEQFLLRSKDSTIPTLVSRRPI
eukprot:scaffold4862_cov124-Chaetoceros_neogracile.AAC.1